MPFGDRTGPRGMGPMTGRGMGYCAGYPTPGYMSPGFGRGWFGRGGGRGWRNWYYATGMPGWGRVPQGMPAFGGMVPPPYPPVPPQPPVPPHPHMRSHPYMRPPTAEDEAAMLKEQAEFLKQQLDDIQKRITELETEKEE